MNERQKPVLAITMGDPAGIGPEVILRAWDVDRIREVARPIVIGHPEVLRRAARMLNQDVQVVEVLSTAELTGHSDDPRILPCIAACDDDVLEVRPGRVDARAGEAAYQAVRLAAKLALERQVDGMVTAPLSKAALHEAGHRFPGHTELLAQICGVSDFAMMLYLRRPSHTDEDGSGQCGLGVVHVTLHQSLRSVFDDVTPEAIAAKCRLVDQIMRRLGCERPRVAVCALNPHAGEEGLFGDEEGTIIAPAIEAARREGLDVTGPFPADTLMLRASHGEFDAVVAMYHDQGHIALKLLDMHTTVNITLGLPIVRTSVAHGTAFDRAWQGTARADGMVEAIRAAAHLAQ